MRSLHKHIKSCVFLAGLILIMLLFPGQVFAESQYKALISKQNVACDKVWNIKLNMDINPDTITSSNVKVVDNSGNNVDVKLGYVTGAESITITPVKNYDEGRTYTVYVENIRSKNGVLLKTPVEMQFTTAAQASKLIDTHTYEITEVIKVTGAAGTNYNLTYNTGTPSSSTYQKELDIKAYGEGASIVKTDAGTNQLQASSSIPDGGTAEYRIVRTVENSGIMYTKDLSNTSGDYSSFKDYSQYTKPEEKIQSDDTNIINKSKELFSGITNPYYKAKKAFEFVNSHMTYDASRGNKSALSALQTGRGVCEDYAELFVALMRASGVPARIVTGYRVESDDFSGSIIDADKDRHAWPEFYLPEYGWIVLDPTFTYLYHEIKTIDYSYFANLDSAGHLIQGYDIDGAYADTHLSISSFGDVDATLHSYIKRIN